MSPQPIGLDFKRHNGQCLYKNVSTVHFCCSAPTVWTGCPTSTKRRPYSYLISAAVPWMSQLSTLILESTLTWASLSKPGIFDRVSGLGPSFTGLAPSTARPARNFDRAGLPMLDRSELGPSLARLGLARKLVFFLANSNLVQPIR